MKLFRFVALSAVAGALLAACGSGTVTDKVGAPGDHATTLRLGAVENESVPYAPQLEHFAAKVDELSNGAVHVDIVWDASGDLHKVGDGEEKALAMELARNVRGVRGVLARGLVI